MRAVAYVRVSTHEQALEGVSIDAQTASVRDYARFKRLDLVELLIDAGVSASKPLATRVGGARLLEMVRRDDIEAVIAFKLDRLFRDAADCLIVTRHWDEVNVDLHLVDMGGQPIDTSTAMGRFFLTIMAGVAEMERNLMAERTSAALQHLKAQGRRVGAVPYGFAMAPDGLHLVAVEHEQRVIEQARQLRAQGLSLRAVAKRLAQAGLVSRGGKPFHPQQLKRLMTAIGS